ncbi:TPA: DUF1132 family protein [Neisseria meningitidis]
MNKPFITQAQLALYKYQPSSKYYGKTMAYTFASELLNYSKVNKFIIHEEIQCFLNRRISNNIWKIYFSDESVAYIKILELQDDSSRGIEIKTFDFNPNVGDVFG